MTIRRMSALLATAAIAAFAASPALAQGKTFTVGVPLPLTGEHAKFGEMKKQAYQMAADEINAKASGWEFKIPDWKANQIGKRAAELFETS